MKIAYVDTSALLAIAFDEPGARQVAGRLRSFGSLIASNLLEAEFRAALLRERIKTGAEGILSSITWLHPDRPLTAEFARILGLGRLRGADLWHLACALYLAPEVHRLSFITLDPQQKDAARKLGFTV